MRLRVKCAFNDLCICRGVMIIYREMEYIQLLRDFSHCRYGMVVEVFGDQRMSNLKVNSQTLKS